MSYLQIANFKPGLDARRSELTSAPGTLETLVNAHINQGGEIEKRYAFVLNTTLPNGSGYTYGLQESPLGLYVFGSATSGTVGALPSPFLYQQLVHPSGAQTMTGVVMSTLYGQCPFVVAKFANGDVLPYYNGNVVSDFVAGLILTYLSTNAGIAAQFASLINSDPAAVYTATQCYGVTAASLVTAGTGYTVNELVTVLGGVGVAATIKVLTVTAGAIATFSVISPGAYTTRPTNPVSVAGATGASATFNLTTVLGSSVAVTDVTGSPFSTVSTQQSATGVIGISVENSGSFAVNALASVGEFTIEGGMSGGSMTSLAVNGVNILASTVNWTSSNGYTATLIVNAINTLLGYTGSASGNKVTLTASTLGSTPNGYSVVTTCAGGLCIGNCSFTAAFNSGVLSIPAGAYNQTMITDGLGVSLLGTTWSSPAWTSSITMCNDICTRINAVSGGTYCASTDGNSNVWLSKKVTSSLDSTIVITVNPGSYINTNAVGTQAMQVQLTPAQLSIAKEITKYTCSASILNGTAPYSYNWVINTTIWPQLAFVSSTGQAVYTVSTATASLEWITAGGRTPGQPQSSSAAVSCSVTDSANNTQKVALPINLGF